MRNTVWKWGKVWLVADMWRRQVKKDSGATRMGFEPTRAEHNGLAVHRLNHSATSSRSVARGRVSTWCVIIKKPRQLARSDRSTLHAAARQLDHMVERSLIMREVVGSIPALSRKLQVPKVFLICCKVMSEKLLDVWWTTCWQLTHLLLLVLCRRIKKKRKKKKKLKQQLSLSFKQKLVFFFFFFYNFQDMGNKLFFILIFIFIYHRVHRCIGVLTVY